MENDLRQRIEQALRATPGHFVNEGRMADAVFAVVGPELERLRTELAEAQGEVERVAFRVRTEFTKTAAKARASLDELAEGARKVAAERDAAVARLGRAVVLPEDWREQLQNEAPKPGDFFGVGDVIELIESWRPAETPEPTPEPRWEPQAGDRVQKQFGGEPVLGTVTSSPVGPWPNRSWLIDWDNGETSWEHGTYAFGPAPEPTPEPIDGVYPPGHRFAGRERPCPHGILRGMLTCPVCDPEKQAAAELAAALAFGPQPEPTDADREEAARQLTAMRQELGIEPLLAPEPTAEAEPAAWVPKVNDRVRYPGEDGFLDGFVIAVNKRHPEALVWDGDTADTSRWVMFEDMQPVACAPRVFRAGDPHAADVTDVEDDEGDQWRQNEQGRWDLVPRAVNEFHKVIATPTWEQLLRHLGPLTEVVGEDR